MSLHRSMFYYKPTGESIFNLELMKIIDKHFLKFPFIGVKRMTAKLRRDGFDVNQKRIRRLYQLMALNTIYPKRNLSKANAKAYKYPYLLKGLSITRPNQVWAIDITYVPIEGGFMYLCAIIDIYSRYEVGFGISNTMNSEWVNEIIQQAFTKYGKPEILNSDQGVQFTCNAYINLLLSNGLKISMDGKGRALDNIFIERLWRRVKYEDIYINDYQDGLSLFKGLTSFFENYNCLHPHQSLDGNKTPEEVYFDKAA